MKPHSIVLSLKLQIRPLLTISLLAGVLQVYNAQAQSGSWSNTQGGSWATAANWSGNVIATGSGNTANFGTLTLSAAPTVTLDGGRTIGNLVFGDLGNTYGWTLNTGSGGVLTLAGTPTITVNGQTSTIGLMLGGTGFTKTGAGTLTLTGAESYVGNTTISAGTLNINGTSTGGSSTGSLFIGGATGIGVLNFNTSGAWTFALSGGSFYVGGNGSTGDTGAGALNQSAGTINFGSGYVTLGAVGSASYGSYVLSGGTLNIENTEGLRDGYGGLGSFVQTGGTLTCPRYFSLGGEGPTGNGVATFLGGVANVGGTSYRFLVPDANGTAVLNIGTEAGGTAMIYHLFSTGLYMEASAGGNGTLNLNSGTLQLGGPIFRNSNTGGSAVVNLNGAILQAGASTVTLINNTLSSVYVYNGGAIFDSTNDSATVSASLLASTGSGIYPTNGVISINSGGGGGYIGAPLVTVSGGSGFGAYAVADVSGGVVTGVTMTCPGQNYLAGDTLSFAFAGGGGATPASTFNYTLKAGDIEFNTPGGVTKLGTGSLTLSSANTYLGNTIVKAGTLNVTVDGGLGQGGVIVSNGAVITLSGGVTNGYISSTASLILNSTAQANLNYSGTDTIIGLSLNGGQTYVAPGTWGAVGSGAPNTSSLLTGSGFIQVTAPTNGTPVELASYTAAQNVYTGKSAVFSVRLGLGTQPAYQWQKTDGLTFTNNLANGATGSGSYILGATSSTLTVSNVSASDAAFYYTCEITNALPSEVISPAAPLRLLVSTNLPVTRPGDTITDFYNAIGTGDPNPSGLGAARIIDGTLLPYLNYGANTPGNIFGGPVGFVVTPSIGSTLVTGARIYTSTNATADDPADFSLYGSDDGVNWSFISYSALSLPFARNAVAGTINSNNEVLQEIDFPNATGYYLYAVYFTNVVGGGAALNGLEFAEVQLLGVATNTAPGIVSQPAPLVQNRLAGGSATFSLTAHGAGPLRYQWYEGSLGSPLTGATNASFTLNNLSTGMNGVGFFCVVSNAYGSITSASVVVNVFAPTPYQSSIIAFNPVAYWPLNETSGTTAIDYGGNNNGTYLGGCTLGQAGIPASFGDGTGTSVAFDGVSGYVDIPVGNLNITGPVTVITWIETSGNSLFTTAIGHTDSNYRLDVDASGLPHFADQSPDVVGPASVANGAWHQLIGVYNHTNATLYVDGLAVATGVEATPIGSSDDVYIGGDPQYSPAGRLFYGNIAEVAILTNALSASQVKTVYGGSASIGAGGDISPLNGEAYVGAPVTYTVNASGAAPLYYQWLVDGVAISGATNSSFTSPAQCGVHTTQVMITNLLSAGTPAMSSLATLQGDAYPTNITFNTSGTGWKLNGSVQSISGNVLELTDGNNQEASSAFYGAAQYVGSFNAFFTYTASGARTADGVAFILQDSTAATNALGGIGGELGYSGILNSAALEINIYTFPGIAAGTNGSTYGSGGGVVYGTTGPVLVTSGDPIDFQLNFANGNLAVTMTDETTSATYTTNYEFVSLTPILGGTDLAYVGFSGATGGLNSIQTISNFEFNSVITPVTLATSPLTANSFVLSWTALDPSYVLQQAPSLTGPWTAGPTAIVVGGVNQATVSIPGGSGQMFYRLMRVVCQ